MPQVSTTSDILSECQTAHALANAYRTKVEEWVTEMAKHCADSRAMIVQSRAIIAEMNGSSPPK